MVVVVARILGIAAIFVLTVGPVAARPAEPAGRSAWRERLTPANVTVTAGTLFPFFLIYEYPAPWAGIEVGWRTNAHTYVMASAGTSVIGLDGSQRYFLPLGIGVRMFPWRGASSGTGMWIQLGLGLMPYVEHTGLMLPERHVGATDFGSVVAIKPAIGVRIRGWDIGMGLDVNLGTSFKNYTGPETRPWTHTPMVWIGAPVWRSQ